MALAEQFVSISNACLEPCDHIRMLFVNINMTVEPWHETSMSPPGVTGVVTPHAPRLLKQRFNPITFGYKDMFVYYMKMSLCGSGSSNEVGLDIGLFSVHIV